MRFIIFKEGVRSFANEVFRNAKVVFVRICEILCGDIRKFTSNGTVFAYIVLADICAAI
ncbi:MAG: hypothetical protein LBQ18_00200 [Campylobacteraceae bacterium]|nr:hypothetical protein [Campylobacteraceae bacterium]